MALPTVRVGGGVWKRQEEIRAELQRRLDESEALRRDAVAEVDRVHSQCVVLLRDNRELREVVGEAETKLTRQDTELLAAKHNVAELMALLTRANDDRSRLESELNAAILSWQQTRDQHLQICGARDKLKLQLEGEELESRRLRDMLYESQEKNECQAQELARLHRQLRALAHSNEAKDQQVVTLIRERDVYAQKLAQCRSRSTGDKPVSQQPRTRADRPDGVTWTEERPTQRDRNVEPGSHAAVVAYEQEKQRLRAMVHQTKAAFDRERETNVAMQKRIDALERGHAELLVRFRQASKAAKRLHVKQANYETEATTNVAAA